MKARVEVFVQLKPGMLDPQGETLEHALESMGYAGVDEMRVGKWITFFVDGGARDEIESRVDEMCRRLLANPVIETYRHEVSAAGSGEDSGTGSGEGTGSGGAPKSVEGPAPSSGAGGTS